MDRAEFARQLDELVSWRKHELAQAKELTQVAQNEDAERYLSRAWLVMLYAHCDQFLKDVVRLYVKYLCHARLPHYRPEFLLVAFNESVTAYGGYISLQQYLAADAYNNLPHIANAAVNKKSFEYFQLRFLCDWVLQINDLHSDYEIFCGDIKRQRDKIAHGEQTYHDFSQCDRLHRKTIQFLDGMTDALMDQSSM
jgi:RiboL-PSP-HEPN